MASNQKLVNTSRRKKLLNFNGFNTLLTILLKNKDKTDQYKFDSKSIAFVKWQKFSKQVIKKSLKQNAINKIIFVLLNSFRHKYSFIFDKLRNVKHNLKHLINDKKSSYMFKCVFNMLTSINTSKCNNKRNNLF